jgi:hypothetical protein
VSAFRAGFWRRWPVGRAGQPGAGGGTCLALIAQRVGRCGRMCGAARDGWLPRWWHGCSMFV